VKPHKSGMQEKDHGKSRARNCGQRHFTSSLCSQITPTLPSDHINTQFSSPHSCKRSSSLTIWDSAWQIDPMLTTKAAVALNWPSQSPTPFGMTNSTATLPSAVRLLKCSISGNPVSFHFFLLYLRYISDAKRCRLVSTGPSAPHCMSTAIPQRYLLRQVFPPCT